ncbi:low-complexity protein [Thioalkalicoccus limnaeus]|uniref:Low-complexity protein n=1 Tax=Thioalkalicoccus limnaeus TaxID=120681 RepID=A0ABV4BBI6_9GAMM
MTKKTMTPAGALVGVALVGSLGALGVAQAGENPFAVQPLGPSYVQLAEGQCGEGKCGEGKCGGGPDTEGKCGEGKCGEGKCGGAS